MTAGSEGPAVLVDTVAAGAAVHVSPVTIRSWAHRGALERKGTDTRGRALYDLAAVYAVAAERGLSRG